MALGTTIDFSMTAREVVTRALRKLNVVGGDETPSASDLQDSLVELNMLLKEWSKYPSLWRLAEDSVTLVADTASYTLDPQAHKVVSARFSQDSREIPMRLLTREEYFDLPLKTSQGIPTQYYVDRQRAETKLYVWPVMASVDSETVEYTYFRIPFDIDAPDNDIDIRSEFLGALVYNLADRLIDDFGVLDGPTAARIRERAVVSLNEALDDDREPEVRFVPGYP